MIAEPWLEEREGPSAEDAEWLAQELLQQTRGNGTAPAPAATHKDIARVFDGAAFVFGETSDVPAVWGTEDAVAWASGEGLTIVGPDGVGKTSLMQQLVLARCGLRDALLGHPVKPAAGRVLYIAADRPRQAQRSFARMVRRDDEAALRDRLVVWKGPLMFGLAESPYTQLADLATGLGASDVFIDSLKDVALDLSKDEAGSRVNIAFQQVISADLELCVSHHQRKEGRDGTGKPKRLADVYGSRWLTAGMGSVILLWGEPGDSVVELVHLKQPADDIGPLKVIHDHACGATRLHEPVDLETALATAGHGLLVEDTARLIFETDATPTPNQIEKARRRLEGLVKRGRAERRDDPNGAARYFLREEEA